MRGVPIAFASFGTHDSDDLPHNEGTLIAWSQSVINTRPLGGNSFLGGGSRTVPLDKSVT